jgi:hypothetical protein
LQQSKKIIDLMGVEVFMVVSRSLMALRDMGQRNLIWDEQVLRRRILPTSSCKMME